jgi:hypothetical protein
MLLQIPVPPKKLKLYSEVAVIRCYHNLRPLTLLFFFFFWQY